MPLSKKLIVDGFFFIFESYLQTSMAFFKSSRGRNLKTMVRSSFDSLVLIFPTDIISNFVAVQLQADPSAKRKLSASLVLDKEEMTWLKSFLWDDFFK